MKCEEGGFGGILYVMPKAAGMKKIVALMPKSETVSVPLCPDIGLFQGRSLRQLHVDIGHPGRKIRRKVTWCEA